MRDDTTNRPFEPPDRGDLVELCREEGIGVGPAERGEGIDRLLDRILVDYERRLGAAVEAQRHDQPEIRRHVDRLAEMMRHLGVLAHKINNPLTSLMGRAQLLRRYAGTDDRVVKAAEVIEESARRIADHVRDLARTVQSGREEGLDPLLDGTDREDRASE